MSDRNYHRRRAKGLCKRCGKGFGYFQVTKSKFYCIPCRGKEKRDYLRFNKNKRKILKLSLTNSNTMLCSSHRNGRQQMTRHTELRTLEATAQKAWNKKATGSNAEISTVFGQEGVLELEWRKAADACRTYREAHDLVGLNWKQIKERA